MENGFTGYNSITPPVLKESKFSYHVISQVTNMKKVAHASYFQQTKSLIRSFSIAYILPKILNVRQADRSMVMTLINGK